MGAKRVNWKRRAISLARIAVDKYGTEEGKQAQDKLLALVQIHPEGLRVPIIRKVISTDQVLNYALVDIKELNFKYGISRMIFSFDGIFTSATFGFLQMGKWPHVAYKHMPPLINSIVKIGPYRFRVIGIDPHSRVINLYSMYRIRDRVRQWIVKKIDSVFLAVHRRMYKE